MVNLESIFFSSESLEHCKWAGEYKSLSKVLTRLPPAPDEKVSAVIEE